MTTTIDFERGALALVLLAAVWVIAVRSTLPRTKRRHFDWIAVGSVASLLPTLCGFPEDRALLAPSLGLATLLGCSMSFVIREWRQPSVSRRRKVLLASCCAFSVLHLVVSPLRIPGRCLDENSRAQGELAAVRSVAFSSPDAQDVLVLNSPNWLVGQIGGSVVRPPSSEPGRWWLLSMTQSEHWLKRTGPRRFELCSVGTAFDVHYFRDPNRNPLKRGDEFAQLGLRVRVLESIRGWPTKIEVDLDRTLEDPALVMVSHVRGQLRVIEPPSLHESIRIPSPGGL